MIYTRPSIWMEYNEDGKNDFICTNAVTYYIRDNYLQSVVQMRSNDVVFGYKNDYAWQLYVLEQMAKDYNDCTHDINFNDPAMNGIAYGELEQLFDGIKAIRKLLIMDTCHSGELFKDEVEEIEKIDSEEEDIVFRSTNATTVLRERQGLKATNEAVKEMFNDLNRGTGTTVISSAGGVEFAMESESWKNGLFTFSFLEGVQSMSADLNRDGKIYLSELQDFVNTEVEIISKGKQKPTARAENISLDYQIW